AEDGIRDFHVTGVQTCALPIFRHAAGLPVEEAVQSAVAAIRDGRQLLDEPNPLTPILDQLTQALRAELLDHAERLGAAQRDAIRSEEHTSELQSRENLVCRLLL